MSSRAAVSDRAPDATNLGGPELVVFASPDDIGSAQMATAWFSLLSDPLKARAVLGGGRVPVRIAAHVAAAMRENGVDLRTVETRLLTPALLTSADLVVTMGGSFDRGLLDIPAPIHREHWLVEAEAPQHDGRGRSRSLRDLIRSRVAMLVFTEGWERAGISRADARVTRPRWHNEAFAAFSSA
ncbi:MAG: arsenate reductase ArsC [Deltaproteobacteria bacterium]|nr:arsenate reductase ArsC [Deltaproteobacteria bacterium]